MKTYLPVRISTQTSGFQTLAQTAGRIAPGQAFPYCKKE
jgi:hypothetical protein